ncbi:MAG: hypothetical protein U0794_09865 [Isosphaeraceae bacterium]
MTCAKRRLLVCVALGGLLFGSTSTAQALAIRNVERSGRRVTADVVLNATEVKMIVAGDDLPIPNLPWPLEAVASPIRHALRKLAPKLTSEYRRAGAVVAIEARLPFHVKILALKPRRSETKRQNSASGF